MPFINAIAKTQGRRPTMEDTNVMCKLNRVNNTLFAVFDGHNGIHVAQMCANVCQRLMNEEMYKTHDMSECIRRVFHTMDKIALHMETPQIGTTALVCIFTPNRIWFANCGDAMGMILNMNGSSSMVSVDHKVENEKERILAAGGNVLFSGGCARIDGVLNVARAIGDHSLKSTSNVVIPDPYVFSVRPTSDIDYIILASDGLWDVFDNLSLSEEIQKNKHKGVDDLARHIVQAALNRGSMDNITIYLVKCSF